MRFVLAMFALLVLMTLVILISIRLTQSNGVTFSAAADEQNLDEQNLDDLQDRRAPVMPPTTEAPRTFRDQVAPPGLTEPPGLTGPPRLTAPPTLTAPPELTAPPGLTGPFDLKHKQPLSGQ